VLVKRRKHVDVMGIGLQNEEFTGDITGIQWDYTWDIMGYEWNIGYHGI